MNVLGVRTQVLTPNGWVTVNSKEEPTTLVVASDNKTWVVVDLKEAGGICE